MRKQKEKGGKWNLIRKTPPSQSLPGSKTFQSRTAHSFQKHGQTINGKIK
jgi:hypothetical protein